MRCLFLLCSESSAIDAPTGRLSAYHILEELTATSFPVVVPQLHLVAMLEKTGNESSKATASAVLSLNGALVGRPLTLSVDFRERERTKVVANIQGIVLPKSGKLTVSLDVENKSLGKWEVNVLQARQQQQTPEASSNAAVIEPTDNHKPIPKRAKH